MKHGETQRPLTRLGGARPGPHQRAQQVVRVREAPAAHLHRPIELPVGDEVTDRSGGRDAFHQRRPAQVVPVDADQLRLVVGRLDELLHRGMPEQGAEEAVEHARRTTALHVAEDRHPCVLTESLLEDALDMTRGDGLSALVAGALRDQNDVGPAARLAAGPQHGAHRFLPVVTGWALRNDDEVGAGGQSGHQGQIAAAAAHHLDDEGALMARRSALDGIDGLDDAVQSSVGADRHVGADHVVVDGTDQPDQGKASVDVGIDRVHIAGRDEFVQKTRPFSSQLCGATEAAVTTDDDECVDATPDEIAGGAP